MIKVHQEIELFDFDKRQYAGQKLVVESHWNDRDLVVLEIGGNRITVEADDLKIAIENATNVNRF